MGEYTVQSRPSKVRSLKEHGLLGELGVITDGWKVRLVGDQTGKAERSGHDLLCRPQEAVPTLKSTRANKGLHIIRSEWEETFSRCSGEEIGGDQMVAGGRYGTYVLLPTG